MLASLELDPRSVPASNVVFIRSSTEARLRWPVHQAVIDMLGVQVLVCFEGTAGRWIREQLGAWKHVDAYQETNGRRWRSEAHRACDGRMVLTLPIPAGQIGATPDPTRRHWFSARLRNIDVSGASDWVRAAGRHGLGTGADERPRIALGSPDSPVGLGGLGGLNVKPPTPRALGPVPVGAPPHGYD